MKYSFFIFFSFFFFLSSTCGLLAQEDSIIYYNKLYKRLTKENSLSPAEIEKNFDRCIVFFTKEKDSILLTKVHLELSQFLSDKGKYDSAFKNLWKALTIAEEKKDIPLQYEVHTKLAYLYGSFKKHKEDSIHKKKILELAKEGIKQNVLDKSFIIPSYYNFVTFYRKTNQIEKAKAYLDTCFYLAEKSNYTYDQKIYLFSEEGTLKLHEGKINEAIDILEKLKLDFLRLKLRYISIIYFNLGNAYAANNQPLIAKQYYVKTLESIEENSFHYDYKAETLFRLSKMLSKLNMHDEAYETLLEYKTLSEHLFSTKSLQNEDLLYIPNLHEEEIHKKDEAIKERDRELLEQKTTLIRFKLSIITIISIVSIGLLFLYLKYQRRKFKLEKEKQLKKVELQKQKNNALIELKNKEITSFTLRLIDKENLINEFIDNINEYAPKNDHLIKFTEQKTTGKTKLWEQFEKRFIDVNKEFYRHLKNKFPDLTPTELKHCALIKLNFSAKEMAQLLNVSLHAVNTSRYRIRKKMQLHREDNLFNFISSF